MFNVEDEVDVDIKVVSKVKNKDEILIQFQDLSKKLTVEINVKILTSSWLNLSLMFNLKNKGH